MDTIQFTLTKVEKYDLKPFGNFTIKWKTPRIDKPEIIPFDELRFDHRESMPIDDITDKQIIKFMKKHKTDILTDGYRFYTRAGSGFTEVWHKKLYFKVS